MLFLHIRKNNVQFFMCIVVKVAKKRLQACGEVGKNCFFLQSFSEK